MAYTTIDNPELYFQTKIYTANGSTTHAITLDGSENMQPDWVWIKNRGTATGEGDGHVVFDSIRGANKRLVVSSTGAESTQTQDLKSFDSDGFTVGSNDNVNRSSDSFVSWNWKAGTSFTNDASSTGVGSIDSAGSVNTDAGFSIVSYTGTGSTGTVAHGLGATPGVIIFKERADDAHAWIVYHHKNTSAPATDYLLLNSTSATDDYADYFNDTAPTSSVFTIDTAGDINGSSDTYIAYCFAEKQGYSKFGSYSGNGNADGSFIYTGFKPAFLIIRRTDDGDNWVMFDNKRNEFNLTDKRLYPNSAAVEATASSVSLDLLSNGFKLRGTDSQINNSSGTYVYLAFAENPFVTSTGIPTPAR
jgi:hypothetical protein